jgi:SOS response regulatory protein OraA/RecX
VTDDDRDDDDLAPVTDLFGARSRRRPGSERPGPGPEPTADEPRSDGPDWRPPVTGAGRPSLVAVPDIGYGVTADAERASVFATGEGQESDDTDAPRSLEEQAADAERISMRTLGRRGVSVSELRTALVKQDLDESVVEGEIERLLGVGLLDDTALAVELVDRLRTRKGLGRQGLVTELRRRGVDPESIEIALAESEADDADEESARALELAVKRAGQLRGLDRETAERRLSGFLMRKGYGSSAVRNAVRRALDGAGPRGSVRFE